MLPDQAESPDSYCVVTLKITSGNPDSSVRERHDTRMIKLSAFDQPVSIGRSSRRAGGRGPPSPTNAIFDSPVVSRDHAQLCLNTAKQLLITDLDSMHGTFVNGQKLEPHRSMVLCADDSVTIGSSITPSTGRAFTAVFFTVHFTFVPAPLSTTALGQSDPAELEEYAKYKDPSHSLDLDAMQIVYETSYIPAIPSSDDLESSPLWDNSASVLMPATKSSRKVSSAYSVPSESSYNSSDDADDNDSEWLQEVAPTCQQGNISPCCNTASAKRASTPDSPALSPTSPVFGPATESPVYSARSPLSTMSDEVDHLDCCVLPKGQYLEALSVEDVRQEDTQMDLLDEVDSPTRELVCSTRSAVIQTSFTTADSAHSSTSPAAATRVSQPLATGIDTESLVRDDSRATSPLGFPGNELEPDTQVRSIVSRSSGGDDRKNNELEVACQRLAESTLTSSDYSTSAPEHSKGLPDAPVSDLNEFESKKRKAADVSATVEAPHSNDDTSLNISEQSAHEDAHLQSNTGIVTEPARKKVRFQAQPTAIQDRMPDTWHEATAQEKSRTYLPTAVSFALGTLVGGVAMVGGLLALPDSFFV